MMGIEHRIARVNKTFKVEVPIGGKNRIFKVIFIGEELKEEKRKLFHSYYGKAYRHLVEKTVEHTGTILYIEKLWSIHDLTVCLRNGLVVGTTYPSRAREDARDWTNKLSHDDEYLIQQTAIRELVKYISY